MAVGRLVTLAVILGPAACRGPVPKGAEAWGLDGRALTPFLDGETPADWREAVHWEYDFREVASGEAEAKLGLPIDLSGMSVIRDADVKYVHFAGLPPLLFDLETDPGETRNVADDPAYLSVRLHYAEKMLAWRTRHLDRRLTGIELTEDGPVDGRER